MVLSESLYQSERLKKMPAKSSAIIIMGTTLRPSKYCGEMKYLSTGRKNITPRNISSPKATNQFIAWEYDSFLPAPAASLFWAKINGS